MKSIKSAFGEEPRFSQLLSESIQIGFWSAVSQVVELIDLVSEFVRRGKQQTDLVDYD